MKKLSIANLKGGTGKTTTATELAVVSANGGARVLVLDNDQQGNASQFFFVFNKADNMTAGGNGNMELTLEWARQYKKWSEQEAEAERERMNPSFNFDVEEENGEEISKENAEGTNDTESIPPVPAQVSEKTAATETNRNMVDSDTTYNTLNNSNEGCTSEESLPERRPNTAHTREIKRAYEDIDEDLQELISEYEADEEMEQVWILERLRKHLAKLREWIGI